MSKKSEIGFTYKNGQREVDLRDAAVHAHVAGEQNGKGEHLAPHEQSRQAHEHSPNGHSENGAATVGHGIAVFGHKEIAQLAHELWVERGCPEGSPEEDWFRAAETLRARAHTPTP